MARFLLDENLPKSLAASLEALGHEVLRAKSVGLSGHPDDDVLAYAQAHGCILITQDQDFGEAYRYAGKGAHAGVIVLRTPQRQSTDTQRSLVLTALQGLDLASLRNCLLVVSPGRARIRKVPSP